MSLLTLLIAGLPHSVYSRATRLFSEFDEALEFMEDYGFNVARVTLLEQYGRFVEAADIHLGEGRTVQAVRLFLKDSSHESKERAESSLMLGLWRELSFGTSLGSETSVARSPLGELLTFSSEIKSQFSFTPRTSDEVSWSLYENFIKLSTSSPS